MMVKNTKDNVTYITKFEPKKRTLMYRTYNFVDKDPVIDLLRTALQKRQMTIKELSVRSGVSEATIQGWFGGSTKRPQFATCQAVARALGMNFVLRG